MVYDIEKNSTNLAYGLEGERLAQAYTIGKAPLLTDTIKVMSYNVGSWTAFGVKATAENQETWYSLQNSILSSENADLAGFQEYYSAIGSYSVPEMLQRYFLDVFAVDWVSTKAGRAIASKYTMSNAHEVNFQNQTGEERSYLIGDVLIDGVNVKFITAHLALDNATIAAQVQELVSAVRAFEYWILTGDFNANFSDVQSTGYEILVKPFLDAGYHVANGSDFGFIPTFSTKKPGDNSDWRCLDNIMCSGNIDILNVYTDKKKITDHMAYAIDHLPLIADVAISH